MPAALDTMLCPKCSKPLPRAQGPGAAALPCPSCGRVSQSLVFPAFFLAKPEAARGALAAESDASCFFHPEKKAELACENCGRYVCALCDIEMAGRHLCPSCLEKGQDPALKSRLDKGRWRWDKIALVASLFASTAFWFGSFIVAPAVLYISFRFFKKTLTVVEAPGVKTGIRVRFILAIILSVLQLLGWAILLATLAAKW